MANFLNQLSKGFIRSAVNQVGRDYGKTISNQVFGNAHATPIRMVRVERGTIIHNPEKIQDDGAIQYHKQEYFNWQDIVCCLLSPLLPLFGLPLYGIYTCIYLFKKTTTFIVWSDCPKRIADRRYRDGYRLQGQGLHKEKIEICNSALDRKTILKGKIKGLIWLVAFIINILMLRYIINLPS